MTRSYTTLAKSEFNATSGDAPLYLLEITHSGLVTPIRVVNNTENITSNGDEYIALGFRIKLPDDFDGRVPKAQLSVDNVGRELTQWLEVAGGGEGAMVRLMQIMPAAPNTIEWEITLELTNVAVDTWQVTGDLGFEDLLGKQAIPLTYRPDTTPGCF